MFDVVVGNPPYQRGRGGTQYQVYPQFYVISIQYAQIVVLVMPTGWQKPSSSQGLGAMNTDKIKHDKHLLSVIEIEKPFGGSIGIPKANILCRNSAKDNGLNGKVLFHRGSSITLEYLSTEEVLLPEWIRQCVERVKQFSFQPMQDATSKSKPYGIRADGMKRPHYYNLPPISTARSSPTDIKIYGSHNSIGYVPNDYPFPRRSKSLSAYKVLVPVAWGSMLSASRQLGGNWQDIIIAFPNEACTESYQEQGHYADFETARKHAKYLMTKFARLLIFSQKNGRMSTTAHRALPQQDFLEYWWELPIKEINHQLISKYGLSEYEQLIEVNFQDRDESNIVNYNKE